MAKYPSVASIEKINEALRSSAFSIGEALGIAEDSEKAYYATIAVNELALFLPLVRDAVPVVPLLYPGLFETDTDQTIPDWLKAWGSLERTPCVLVAGQHAEAGNRSKLRTSRLQDRFSLDLGSVPIFSQVDADNTPQQANWVAEMVKHHDIRAIALWTHASHLPRAYLTQLKALIKHDLDQRVALLPWKRPANPFAVRQLTGPWDDARPDITLVPGEVTRIREYSEKGDVATFPELMSYCERLFAESPVARVLSTS